MATVNLGNKVVMDLILREMSGLRKALAKSKPADHGPAEISQQLMMLWQELANLEVVLQRLAFARERQELFPSSDETSGQPSAPRPVLVGSDGQALG